MEPGSPEFEAYINGLVRAQMHDLGVRVPIKYTTNRNGNEKVQTIPMNGVKHSVFSHTVDLVAGDWVSVTGEVQVTNNDPNADALVGTEIIIGTDPNDNTAILNGWITEGNGRNVLRSMHHDTQSKTAMMFEVAVTGSYEINFLVSAASGVEITELRIDQDYGHFDVVIWRLVTPS